MADILTGLTRLVIVAAVLGPSVVFFGVVFVYLPG
jgi:hypothetical protein